VTARIFSIVNMDVDFVSASCWGTWGYASHCGSLRGQFASTLEFAGSPSPSRTLACAYTRAHRYKSSFTLKLLLPIIPFSLVCLSSALAWLWSRFISVRSVCGVHLHFMCEDAASVREHLLSGFSLAVPFLHIVYNSICVTVFSTLRCFQMADGDWRLSAAADVVCWDSREHQAMIAASVLATFVYIIGVPLYTFVLLMYLKRNDQFKQPEWLKVLGFLYVRYGTLYPLHAVSGCPACREYPEQLKFGFLRARGAAACKHRSVHLWRWCVHLHCAHACVCSACVRTIYCEGSVRRVRPDGFAWASG
jgi:hypothetical protein